MNWGPADKGEQLELPLTGTESYTSAQILPYTEARIPQSPVKGDLKEALRGGKAQLSQLSLGPATWEARVKEYGAKKYERGNYLRPQVDALADYDRLSAYLDACLRHILAATTHMEYVRGTTDLTWENMLDGANCLDESGLPHLAHALCSLTMAIQQGINCGLLPADPSPK